MQSCLMQSCLMQSCMSEGKEELSALDSLHDVCWNYLDTLTKNYFNNLLLKIYFMILSFYKN